MKKEIPSLWNQEVLPSLEYLGITIFYRGNILQKMKAYLLGVDSCVLWVGGEGGKIEGDGKVRKG